MRLALRVCAALLIFSLCGCSPAPAPVAGRRESPRPLDESLRGPAAPSRDGVAAAILVDTSGSMKDGVRRESGRRERKIAIARRCVMVALRSFEDFAAAHPEEEILVGVYEFSSRSNEPPCRTLVPLGVPDSGNAEKALRALRPAGGTPIGWAMIHAKRDLDATGLRRRHLVVVTDGENNRGYSPGVVAAAIARLEPELRADIHLVAFDIAAERFNAVTEAGGLVLGAADEGALGETLDYILTGRILAEKP